MVYMIGSLTRDKHVDKLRYRYLAYFVVRDAIGFYFGIPKFMDSIDRDKVIAERLEQKIAGRDVPEEKVCRYRELIEKSVDNRISHLAEDFQHCEDVLFNDNIWLQLLDIDCEFFKSYLHKLSTSTTDELAIVPNWTTRDDSLSRPYLISERDVRNLKF